ncbi:MAG: hypothetical protein U0X39_00540 [Bacteroidales bacterium]
MGQASRLKVSNPFPGLRPFLPGESDLFFGRENESNEVISRLAKNHFVTIIGASGTGKSSLIFCGVIPGFSKALGDTELKVVTFRPGNDPVRNLSAAFSQIIQVKAGEPDPKESVENALRSGKESLSSLATNKILSGSGKLLVVVDQFEELFRYTSDKKGALPGKDAHLFVSLLEGAVQKGGSGIYVIITMRSDFIGECAHFQDFTQLINSSNYLVPHMNRDNYRAVIEGPVKYAGATIEPALIEKLLDDIGEQTDQLPVLQHALMRTWEYWRALDDADLPISSREYDSVGTMDEAMSRHANEAYEELDQAGKLICEKMFKIITEKGTDNKGVRNPTSVRLIRTIIGCTADDLYGVIDSFRVTSRSFLTPRENVPMNDESVIDVSHESLMRLWNRLRQWVEEEAESVQMYLRLSEASAMYQQGKTTLWRPPDLQLAINWREQQRPTLAWAERYDPAFERAMVYLRTSEREYQAEEENKIMMQKRQIKRTRIVAGILASAAIVAVVFMLYAFIQQIAAESARKDADANAQKERVARAQADSSAVQERLQKEIADENRRKAQANEQIANERKIEADLQRRRAEDSANVAITQRNIARIQTDSAIQAKQRADNNYREAEKQRIEALRQRMLSTGKSMSVKSLQLNSQSDLQSLLAYQAYLFNKQYNGIPYDADIYMGLYNVSKQFKNTKYVEYKGHTDQIKSIAMVPGKPEFYTSAYDKKVLKWSLDSKTKDLQVVYTGDEVVEVLAVSPDAAWLACGGDNSSIRMIPLKGGNNMQYELKGHTGKIRSLVFSFDGKYLYSASLDGKVLKWDLATKTSVVIDTEKMQITFIDISSGGKYIAGVSPDGKALVWNTDRPGENFRIETPGKSIKIVRFKPDDNVLALGFMDGTVEFWDITNHRRISSMKAHTAEINDIRFNNRYMQMATASNDNTLKLWNLTDLTTPPVTFNDQEGFVMAVEFSADGQLVISGSYKGPNNLVGRPTTADIMAGDFCSNLGRNMTEDEWATYVGKDLRYEKTCTDKDFSIKVNVIK